MADNDSLLDVFVNVQPHPDSVNALKAHLDQVVGDATRAFNQLGLQANAIAQRAEFIRNGGRGRGGGGGAAPTGKSPEEQQMEQIEQAFRNLSAQIRNDISSLNSQLSRVGADELKRRLEGVRTAFREISNQQIDLGVSGSKVELNERIAQLRQLRLVLEGIQSDASVSTNAGDIFPTRALTAAQNEARRLRESLAILKTELLTAEAPDLVQSLRTADLELRKVVLDLKNVDEANLGANTVDPFLYRLRLVRDEIEAIRQEGSTRPLMATTVSDTPAQAISAARKEASLLARELRIAEQELAGADAPQLIESIRRADLELKKVVLDLGRLDEKAVTTTALDRFADRLRLIGDEIEDIRTTPVAAPSQGSGVESVIRQARTEAKLLNADIEILKLQLTSTDPVQLKSGLKDAGIEIRKVLQDLSRLDVQNLGQDSIDPFLYRLRLVRDELQSIDQQRLSVVQTYTPGAGIAEDVERARRQTLQLQKELQIAKGELREAEAPNLVNDLNRADVELKQILFDLSELNNAGQGPVFMQGFLNRINQVQAQITNTRQLTQEAIQNELRGRDQVADALDHQAMLQIRIQELERSSGAIPAQQKQVIARLKAAIAEANYELGRQKSEIDGTQQSWYRYLLALGNVNAAQENLVNELNNIQTAGGVSFNTLGNNVYQLGQAFEDAAIGYQLNGISGAVRGASNNVSFLLNNLSQVPSVQKAIADRFGIMEKKAAVILPGIAAFAGVLGITVLPAMAEWLASLDDIEYQLDDLADQLKRQFSDADLEIKIGLDERKLERDLAKMKTVRDVLEEIDNLRTRSEDIVFNVQAQIADLATGDASTAFARNLSRFSTDLQSQINKYQAEVDRLTQRLDENRGISKFGSQISKTTEFLFGGGAFDARGAQRAIGQNLANLGPLRNAQDFIETISSNIKRINEDAQKGILNAEDIRQTRNAVDSLNFSLESNADYFTNVSGSTAFEKTNEALKELSSRLDGLIEPAREFESIVSEQLNRSVFAVTLKTEQLAARQQLFRDELAGTASEYDVLLLDVSELSRTYEDLIRSNLEFYKSVGKSAEELERFKSVLTQEARLQTENALLEDQQDIIDKLRTAEEKLDQLRSRKQSDKSRRTSLEQFTTALQEAALSIGTEGLEKNTQAMERLTDEVDRLRDALQKIEAAQDIVASGGGSAQLRDLSLAPAMRARIPGMIAAGFGGPIGGIANAMQLFGGDVNQAVLGNRSKFSNIPFETMPIRGVDPTQERMLESVDGLRKDINRIAERQEMKKKMTEGSNWKAAIGP